MDKHTILAGIAAALAMAAKVGDMLSAAGVPFAGAISTGVKIATGVAAEVPFCCPVSLPKLTPPL